MMDTTTTVDELNSIPPVQSFLSAVRALPLGEKLAWSLFCLTCLNAAFVFPSFAVIEGDRAKLLTALFCFASLIASISFVKRSPGTGAPLEAIVSAVLTCLVLISSSLSATPEASMLRAFSVVISALGGFWCARFLINSPQKREFFTWFCTGLLSLIIILSFTGYFFYGGIEHFLDVNVHPLANRMLLLAFGPLALILGKVKRNMIIGGSVLCLGYAVCFLSDLRSAVLIPVVLGGIAVAFGSLRARRFLLILAPLTVVIVLFFNQLPIQKLQPNYEPAYYRIENYPFSWHIAVRNPFFGNGLRAPREKYLDDYQLMYRYSTKEKFADSTKRIVVSENIFLTFMAELGFPFLIIYTGSLGILLIRLTRWASKPKQLKFVPALALLLPLLGAVMHFFVLDGLLHPHVSWFFHVLLGMIPRPESKVPTDS